ncbi:dihydrolipoyl dehydrogenase family protein [Agromyces seonyuensis]|uniref:Pyridine nucleotide-disulfide oxidoreductase n=1 Tax=Agromyces seonyuensis TaxID=2662446 RepID=A0A6I4P3N3_9MICO|nr:NAD(P)/FAD-dependent oxidoreductase [Agromyces seonyuensis]MWB98809.1 pyridine nucleotide-disulfide oxidoreductase [Agromyces seonyuensis]
MSETIETDVIVLGAGPVGENVADRTRAAGLDTVIVERELVGGECSYWACVPSKVLLRSAAALRDAKALPGAAEAVTGELDPQAVFARRDRFVGDWDDSGGADWLASIDARLLRGTGRFDGPKRVVVTDDAGAETLVVARHAVVVATGSEPVVPPIPGLAEVRPWGSREATGAHEVPARLAVVGGGVVAVEMATAYAGFGSEVTIIQRGTLLHGFEDFAGEAVAAGLEALGARVLLGKQVARASRDADGTVTLELDDGTRVEADEVLVATGRRPRTGDLGLETLGLEPGAKLDVDDSLAVPTASGGWLYAVGDVNGRAPLTHQGKYEARAVGDGIAARVRGDAPELGPWGADAATADHRAVPQVVFSSPEVAAVGLTESAARAAGFSVRAVEVPLTSAQGAQIHVDGADGRAKLVVDARDGLVLGATFVGDDVAELLHAATVAIVGQVSVRRLWHAVPAFPSVSEVWLRLLEALGRESARGADGGLTAAAS